MGVYLCVDIIHSSISIFVLIYCEACLVNRNITIKQKVKQFEFVYFIN